MNVLVLATHSEVVLLRRGGYLIRKGRTAVPLFQPHALSIRRMNERPSQALCKSAYSGQATFWWKKKFHVYRRMGADSDVPTAERSPHKHM